MNNNLILCLTIESTGNSSSSVLSLPFGSSSLSSMSSLSNYSSANNNTKNNNNITNNLNTSNSNNKQTRKERTCKGKRYLEILNENKFGKRNRAVSPIGAHSEKGEMTNAKNVSNNQSSSTSKWVSGGFDLEERIKALPQLGDTHLLNALSHSKANKTIGSHKSSTNANHIKKVNNCAAKESANVSGDENGSDIEDNDDSTKLDDNTLRHSSKKNNVLNIENLDETNVERKNDVEKSEPSVESLRTTQQMECDGCDGLAALAEVAVALQQERNTIH